MDLYHLNTFCRVARFQSFTRAAEDMSLSQSAVSRHIDALEQEHGTQLFTRSGRGATLTEAGLRLLEYAEQMLHLSQEATRALAELRDVETGRLAVGASTTPGNYLLGPVVTAYQDRYPGVDLHLEIRDSQSVIGLLEDGTLDVAVIPEFPVTVGIVTEPLMPDELVLVAAPTHPLASRPVVRLEDLAGTRVFLREPGSHSRRAVEQWLAARNATLQATRELGSTEAIKQAVAAGGGVAFCSRYALILELRQGVLKVLSGPDLTVTRQLVVAYTKGGRRPPATMAFAALLRKLRPSLEARVAGTIG